ncbi:MAG: hypothetical protein ACP5D1_13425, partial [Bacteroidales bacterium]
PSGDNRKNKNIGFRFRHSGNREKRIHLSDSLKLIGHELEYLMKIVPPDSIPGRGKDFFLLYFSGYDCDPCIFRSFELLKIIKQLNWETLVVLSDGSVGEIRRKFDYNGYIYQDHDFLLNRQLNYTGTPVLLILDSLLIIKSTYHPGEFDEESMKCFENFLKKVDVF